MTLNDGYCRSLQSRHPIWDAAPAPCRLGECFQLFSFNLSVATCSRSSACHSTLHQCARCYRDTPTPKPLMPRATLGHPRKLPSVAQLMVGAVCVRFTQIHVGTASIDWLTTTKDDRFKGNHYWARYAVDGPHDMPASTKDYMV